MPENMIIDGVLHGVSAVVIDNNGKILMLYRSSDAYKSGWEFVKGGLQVGETHYMAALREIKEEAGVIEVELIGELPKSYLVDVKYRKKNYSVVMKKTLVFLYRHGTPQVSSREHSKYEWMTLTDACNLCWVEYGDEILRDAFNAFTEWLDSHKT